MDAHQPAAAALPQKKKPVDDEEDEPAPEVEEVKRKVRTKPSLTSSTDLPPPNLPPPNLPPPSPPPLAYLLTPLLTFLLTRLRDLTWIV